MLFSTTKNCRIDHVVIATDKEHHSNDITTIITGNQNTRKIPGAGGSWQGRNLNPILSGYFISLETHISGNHSTFRNLRRCSMGTCMPT